MTTHDMESLSSKLHNAFIFLHFRIRFSMLKSSKKNELKAKKKIKKLLVAKFSYYELKFALTFFSLHETHCAQSLIKLSLLNGFERKKH